MKIAPHALNQRGFVSDTVENRVSDLHEMFADPSVRAIVAAIGGNHSCHLLPRLDFELIRANPIILMGFSDLDSSTPLRFAQNDSAGVAFWSIESGSIGKYLPLSARDGRGD